MLRAVLPYFPGKGDENNLTSFVSKPQRVMGAFLEEFFPGVEIMMNYRHPGITIAIAFET